MRYKIVFLYHDALGFRDKDGEDETRKHAMIQSILVTMGQRPIKKSMVDVATNGEHREIYDILDQSEIRQTITSKSVPFVKGHSWIAPDGKKYAESPSANPSRGYCIKEFSPKMVEYVESFGGGFISGLSQISAILKKNLKSSKSEEVDAFLQTLDWLNLSSEEFKEMFVIHKIQELAKNKEGPALSHYFGSKRFGFGNPTLHKIKPFATPTPGQPLKMNGDTKTEKKARRHILHSGKVELIMNYESALRVLDIYRRFGVFLAKIEDGGLFEVETDVTDINLLYLPKEADNAAVK